MEQKVQQSLLANKGSANDLKQINTALLDLCDYDDASPVAQDARDVITAQRSKLIDEAVALYNKGQLDSAAQKFRLIQTIYQKDHTADKYLARILSKQEHANALKKAKEILAKARQAIKEKKFTEAIELADRVLDADGKNNEAKKIKREAREHQEAMIPDLIAKGKAYYNKQDFKNAKAAFQSVLVFDPDENTSLTYIKKIERQLETIESLK